MSRLILALALVTGVAGLGYIVPPEFCKQWEPTGCSANPGSSCSFSSGTGTCDVFALTPEVFTVEFTTETSLITMPPEIVDVSISTVEYLFPYAYTSTNGMPDFPITIRGDLNTDTPNPIIGYPVYTFTLEGGNLQFTNDLIGDECVITYACAE